eukprot:TRINITY_DN3797_c0_g1_i1.p1 TRINITY_DN3797_c0_g1~~TRINITY_DN3797_c0_g1_i1.p1  ORF type:complete len:405 (+),score=110.49 TRINITY_DN3797_c0_g1_i1:194-1408(+)
MEQLKALKEFYEQGYINKDEFEHRKNQLINKLTSTTFGSTDSPFSDDNVSFMGCSTPTDHSSVWDFIEKESSWPVLNCEKPDETDTFVGSPSENRRESPIFSMEMPPTSSALSLSYEDKRQLVDVIANLDTKHLESVVRLISSNAPHLIKDESEDNAYSFDLSQFDDNILLLLHAHINGILTASDVATTPVSTKRKEQSQPDAPEAEATPPKKFRPESECCLMDTEDNERTADTEMALCNTLSDVNDHQLTEVAEDKKPKKIRLTIQVYHVQKSGKEPKPWMCDAPNCNKTFSDSSNLIKHIRTHTQEKPYECEECGKSFSHKGTLREHMHTHSGRKPFVCEFCDKSFAQNSNLARHLRLHTGEKPFVCEECGKDFNQSTNLKTHMHKVHGKSTTASKKTLQSH